LQLLSLFYDIDRNELAEIAGTAHILHFVRGEIINREGEVANTFNIILRGTVKALKCSLSGKEFTIAVRHANEILGLSAAIKGWPHFASVIAFEETDIVAIGRKEFLNLMCRNFTLTSRIIDLEAERIENLYDKIIDLVADNTEVRLRKVLQALYLEYGNILCFTHKDLADMTGTTLETATKILRSLEESKVLNLSRCRITIVDGDKLSFTLVTPTLGY
jgi:CRP-like cAMP-binding protein